MKKNLIIFKNRNLSMKNFFCPFSFVCHVKLTGKTKKLLHMSLAWLVIFHIDAPIIPIDSDFPQT